MTWRSSLLSPDRLSAADYQLRRFPGHLQAGHGSCDGLPAHGRPHVPHRCRRPHLPRWLRRPRRHPRRHPDLLGQHVWPPSGGRVCHGVRSSRSAAPALPPPGLAKRHPAHPCTINYATDLHSLARPPPPPPPPGRRRRRYCCTMRRSRKLLFASMAQPSCTEWSCAAFKRPFAATRPGRFAHNERQRQTRALHFICDTAKHVLHKRSRGIRE